MKGDRSMTSREMGVGDTNIPDEITHDYAACQDLSCVRCDAYGDGYSAGKEMAYFEVRNWHLQL